MAPPFLRFDSSAEIRKNTRLELTQSARLFFDFCTMHLCKIRRIPTTQKSAVSFARFWLKKEKQET